MNNNNNNKSILIVDDIESNSLLLQDVLRYDDYTTITSSNGKDALDILEKRMIDLVLLDVIMPEMDGFEVLEEIIKNNHRKLNSEIFNHRDDISAISQQIKTKETNIIKISKLKSQNYCGHFHLEMY